MTRKTKQTEAAVEAQVELTEAELAEDAAFHDGQADEADEVVTRSVVPRKWRNVYNHSALKGSCADQLAFDLKAALANMHIQVLGDLNGIDVQARWGARNPGMQRMNLGNVLRNRIKRGEEVRLS